jgi:sensor histidine kinase YesM
MLLYRYGLYYNEWFSYINIPNINITNIPNIVISNISVGIKNLFKDNSKIVINGNGSSLVWVSIVWSHLFIVWIIHKNK